MIGLPWVVTVRVCRGVVRRESALSCSRLHKLVHSSVNDCVCGRGWLASVV